ncbi:helix-turn-helix transcriptional regulator [Croceicoccus naphthovorans]|uniref:Uncharacterized protein n=1 Tax=Croceicoccus naphthovorans TaxID=1348774 RepID=A0A0G3XGR0_9SPHN|nr:helix-turn-helix transcriptional regulator [Croceicoccus naphthovorans]AKM09809.1 hypothetical protein AB433_07150 [Croceicoccus naphthovorans]MBB3990630.1 transcriptional regulator with XRE-family HTH domain [Croceicoccus naphthovorans]
MEYEDPRKQLGKFIRAHRERMPPEGILRRSRTPGLRREELAARAGIGTTWCAWIEQGREVNVSPEALNRLAKALELTAAERRYLFELGGRRDPDAPMDTTAPAPASVLAMVSAQTSPAYGLDSLWNVTCWNGAAQNLFSGWLDRDEDRNLLRFTFLSTSARSLIVDWEERARRLIFEFRADCASILNDPALATIIEELKAKSAFFANEWEAQGVVAREGGIRTFLHPEEGELTFKQCTFNAAERPDHKLVVLIPV